MPRTRSRSTLTAAAVVALGLALAGCASAPAASTEQTARPTPSATPTAEALVVAPGAQPPVVFGGDCTAAIDSGELADALGAAPEGIAPRDVRWSVAVTAVGGMSCEWAGGRIDIMPQAGLGDAEIPPPAASDYFEECDWSCAWLYETDELWITGAHWTDPEQTREQVDAIGAALGPRIASRWDSAPGRPWRFDSTAWWPVIDCDAMADAVGDQLGAEVTSEEFGYHDPPGPAMVIADAATNMSWCALRSGGQYVAIVQTHAGPGWALTVADDEVPVDLGVPGIQANTRDDSAYLNGATYKMTDGVNLAWAEVSGEGPWSQQQIATAIAAAAASDFS